MPRSVPFPQMDAGPGGRRHHGGTPRPARVDGRDRVREAPLRIGMIGLGMIGQYCHLPNFTSIAGCVVTAVSDLREEVARTVARQWNIGAAYASHRDLLRDADVDAVVVATRRDATGPIVLDCLRSGRHVLSEKPIAMTAADARTLVKAAEAAGVVYAVGYMKRHDPGYRRGRELVREALADERHGALLCVRGHNYCGRYPQQPDGIIGARVQPQADLETWPVAPGWVPAGWRGAYDWFVNVQVHQLNVLRDLLPGRLRVRHADFRSRHALLHLDAGGVPVTLAAGQGYCGRWHEGVELLFAEARIAIDFPSPLDRAGIARVTVEQPGQDRWQPEDRGTAPWSFHRQAEAFVHAIRDRVSPVASGVDARADMILCEAVWRRFLGVVPGRDHTGRGADQWEPS